MAGHYIHNGQPVPRPAWLDALPGNGPLLPPPPDGTAAPAPRAPLPPSRSRDEAPAAPPPLSGSGPALARPPSQGTNSHVLILGGSRS